MQKPNFFIIGASKCGTTALSRYLREHKDIFFSDPKEPRFFSSDFPEASRRIQTLDAYERLFIHANGYKAVGEGSAYYSHSNVAIPQILQYNPDARFIFMVRNPIELVRSWHTHLLLAEQEHVEDFEKAWCTQQNSPHQIAAALSYKEIGKLGERLEWLLQYIHRDRLLIIFFDDLKERPRDVYQKVLKFLCVPDDGRTNFPVINRAQRVRYPKLRHWILILRKWRRKHALIWHTGLAEGLIKKIMKYIMTDHVPTSLRPGFRKELITFFYSDIKKLAKLTNRDLTTWLQ